MVRLLALVCALAAPAAALVLPMSAAKKPIGPTLSRTGSSPTMLATPPEMISAGLLLSEIVDADGERAYGAVDAPAWVLPVVALLTILTSLLPLLLQPGEEALEKMRENEGNLFGTGKELGTGKRGPRNR